MEMNAKVTVRDAMTSNVLTIGLQTSVAVAAQLMAKYKIGSLIVKSNSKPEGLITESDIIRKVVSKDLKASNISINEVMIKDLITISPKKDLNEAARVMVKNNIRRLPVVNGGILVGILTSSDVLMVSPELTEILVEDARMQNQNNNYVRGPYPVPGVCEGCGNFMDDLLEVDGEFLCEDCMER